MKLSETHSIMKCKICDSRKPRRYCPGVGGDICSICCGAEREVTVSCPLDCPFLMESRAREKPNPLNPEDVPDKDIPVTREFLEDHEPLLIFLGAHVLEGALAAGATDLDAREALQSLIRTYRTLETGIYYETRPTNPIAGAVHSKIQTEVQSLRDKLREKGATGLRDAEVLGVLVFLERVWLHQNNGRPRGRAFVDYLRRHFSTEQSVIEKPQALIQA